MQSNVAYFYLAGISYFYVYVFEVEAMRQKIKIMLNTCMRESDGSSRQHGFQATFEVRLGLVRPTRMPADMLPHDVDHRRSDQTVLNYEREQIRRSVLDDSTHDVDTSARVRYRAILRQGFRVDTQIRTPEFAAVCQVAHIEDLRDLRKDMV